VRFRVEAQVCVEVDSVEELDAVVDRVEIAAAESAGADIVAHPDERWVSSVAVEGLDDESKAALIAQGRWSTEGACRLPDRPSPQERPAEPTS
jgi:hypothetical protein